ncbi:MAG: hypothetical protein V2A73_04815, partial [Pseudomonadota bacterium]
VVGLSALLSLGGRLTRRLPWWLRHGAVVLGLGWFIAWHSGNVWALRGGKAAPDLVGHPPGRSVAWPLRRAAEPIWQRIGNPFSFPANVYFSLRYGVPLKRWDEIAGRYVYLAALVPLQNGRFRLDRATWPLADPFLLGGFGPSQKEGSRAYRKNTERTARALVPIHLPEALLITLPLGQANPAAAVTTASEPSTPPRARIRWNGRQLAETSIASPWTDVVFVVPEDAVNVGENVLELEAAPGTVRIGWPVIGFPQPGRD